jgi:hypothetical protein
LQGAWQLEPAFVELPLIRDLTNESLLSSSICREEKVAD